MSTFRKRPEELPEDIQELARHLYRWGFTIDYDDSPNLNKPWTLNPPPTPALPPVAPSVSTDSHTSPNTRSHRAAPALQKHTTAPVIRLVPERFDDDHLDTGLLSALRKIEQRASSDKDHKNTLIQYHQYEGSWATKIYNRKDDTTNKIKFINTGCAPTALAVVMQYIANNTPDNTALTQRTISPDTTATHLLDHGFGDHGTTKSMLLRSIQEDWPDFTGWEVTINEAEAILRRGELLIIGCKPCLGYSKNDKTNFRTPDRNYPNGHYMVLTGVDPPPPGAEQLFWVHDVGYPLTIGIYRMKRSIIEANGRLYYVYRKGSDHVVTAAETLGETQGQAEAKARAEAKTKQSASRKSPSSHR